MAGTLDIVQRCYAELEARDGVLWLNPQLPPELESIKLDALYRDFWLRLEVTDVRVRISACQRKSQQAAPPAMLPERTS